MLNVRGGAKAPQLNLFGETDAVCATPDMHYLWPSRYFHFYVLYDRKRKQTCWLPEGYGQ